MTPQEARDSQDAIADRLLSDASTPEGPAWPGDQLPGDFRTAEDQAKTARRWLGSRRQAKDQIEAEAT
jgi:hypothetical protein